MKQVPEEIQQLLDSICDHFDQEDDSVRQRQIRKWRHLKYMWEGFTKIWYSEVAHDWRVFDDYLNSQENTDQSYYDQPINVFRAYLETIIAALSITVPAIRCYPDDADNPLDLSTAKAGDKIANLISKHNDINYAWLHALYVYGTEGLVACYNYSREDEKYGTYDEKKYEDKMEEQYICPNCKVNLGDELLTSNLRDEYDPNSDGNNVELENVIQNEGSICPECASLLNPNLQKTQFTVSRLVGITKKPKSRQCMEVYGGLYVKVPNYALCQEDIPYLRFSYETHYSNAIERFPKLRNSSGSNKIGSGSAKQDYETQGRLSLQYNNEYPINTVTCSYYWLRPSSFNVLGSEEETNELKKKFPNGAKITRINDVFCDAEDESLDDHWTLTKNPLADSIHHDPLGSLLTSVQQITNELISLIMQTIEHGIPQTFADPAVLNFKQYRETEVLPGGIFPAKPASGKSVGEGFYTISTATLSDEVLPFLQKIQELGQLVSGALPSLFGGAASGSKTAAEYQMSQAQARQRIQNTWKTLTVWWKTIYGKTIPAYIKDMKDDEHIVEKDELGNFVNVFVRKAETQGKIGSIELEASEELPVTWGQKKDVIMKLMETNNPVILPGLTSPENLPILHEAIGLDDFFIPGEDDRQKQYEEIKLLVESEPIIQPSEPIFDPMTGEAIQGPEQEVPSVEVEPDVDDHEIQFSVCRKWLVSEVGRQTKLENEKGYRNVLLHAKMHLQLVQQSMTGQQAMQQQQQPEAEKAQV